MSGEVISIGLRTTRIRTGDNRRIIVPNSELGESAVINYSQPEPSYRVQVDFVVVGGSFEQLELIIVETVRAIEGVLPDKPVDVNYLSLGREIRVGWWVESVSSQLSVQTKVFVALEKALKKLWMWQVLKHPILPTISMYSRSSNRQMLPKITISRETEVSWALEGAPSIVGRKNYAYLETDYRGQQDYHGGCSHP
jgi:hypothetical protein